MKGFYFISTESYSGKTGLILGLGLKLKEKNYLIGYFKPIGNLPKRFKNMTIDEDADYIAQVLELKEPLQSISPIVLTEETIEEILREGDFGYEERIKESFDHISQGKDVVLVEGGSGLAEGKFIKLATKDIPNLLDLLVILVAKGDNLRVIDEILEAKEELKERLFGVIFNYLPPGSEEKMEGVVKPFVKEKGINVLGVIPMDKTLLGVTIEEIVSSLKGKFLCCPEKGSELVETFMVGAMGQEKALRFFRRKGEKAVITGGDRADVQLAALETPTKCLILTGNLHPSPVVVSRSEELGVPIVLVPDDTFTTIEKMEMLIGRVRVHEPQKLKKMKTLVEEHVDLEQIYQAIKQ